MKFRFLFGLMLLVLLAGSLWLLQPTRSAPISANLSVAEALSTNDEGFARVTEPRQWSFPADHGPHPEYKTEWWYYTGNLESADGRHWGFQLTFFRSGLTANPADRSSHWAAQNMYMSHLALTDVASGKFYSAERFSRDGAGLAGAQADPFHVWTESWEANGSPTAGTQLRANHENIALDLVVRSTKPPVLQGENGFSRKSAEPGAASYYYSLTRMETSGTITVDGQPVEVTGLSWMDREWSTSVLAPNQIGWDWFALQLSDGSDLMFFQLRLRDGGIEPLSSGSLVAPDGSVTTFTREDVTIEVLKRWTSPQTNISYPSQWRVSIPAQQLDLLVEPYIPHQELLISLVYWEGAVQVTGTRGATPLSGSGYIEMTGYGDTPGQAVPNRPR